MDSEDEILTTHAYPADMHRSLYNGHDGLYSVADSKDLARSALARCSAAPPHAAALRGVCVPLTDIPVWIFLYNTSPNYKHQCTQTAQPHMQFLQQANEQTDNEVELVECLPNALPHIPITSKDIFKLLNTLAVRVGPDPYDPETTGGYGGT